MNELRSPLPDEDRPPPIPIPREEEPPECIDECCTCAAASLAPMLLRVGRPGQVRASEHAASRGSPAPTFLSFRAALSWFVLVQTSGRGGRGVTGDGRRARSLLRTPPQRAKKISRAHRQGVSWRAVSRALRPRSVFLRLLSEQHHAPACASKCHSAWLHDCAYLQASSHAALIRGAATLHPREGSLQVGTRCQVSAGAGLCG